MDLRHLGDTMLRPRASLFSFLAPSLHPSWPSTSASRQPFISRGRLSKRPRRTLHTSSHQAAPSSSSSAADLGSLEDLSRPDTPQPSSAPPSQKNTNISRMDDLVDSVLKSGSSQRRKPHLSPKDTTSASMVEEAFRKVKANEYYGTPLRDRGNQQQGSIVRGMEFPSGDTKTDADKTTTAVGPAVRAKRIIISRPSVGRTIEVDPERNVDFGRALRTLDIQCAVNRVRAESQKQRFHERPGLKRKRLKSERWRKLFRASFRATVQRVKEMRRKGW